MLEHLDGTLRKARFLIVALLVVGNLFLLSLLPTIVEKANLSPQAKAPSSSSSSIPFGDANVVSDGLTQAMNQTGHVLATVGNASGDVLGFCGGAVIQSGKFFGGVLSGGGRLIARGTASTVGFIVRAPINMIDSVSNTAAVGALIKPKATDAGQIPVIGIMPEGVAAQKAVTAEKIAQPVTNNDAPAWPIHGAITTYFGASDWPYQVTHTGLDISDGTRPGTTPVYPFKSGTVTQVIHSSTGLGNHIIIDHGDGVTSVYAHLNSTSVQPGQVVNKSVVLGMEGTTGASTGTHLHFEIMVNGQYVDPLAYVGGRP